MDTAKTHRADEKGGAVNCPYCQKFIPGMTGFQEAANFQRHLNRCRKTPAKRAIRKLNQTETGAWAARDYDLTDALEIRANSGQ